MIVACNNNQILLRKIENTDLNILYNYLNNLSCESKSRFGPHAFDKQSIINFYTDNTNTAFIAINTTTNEIVAYCIIKTGFLVHDKQRLESYGLQLNNNLDCTFAPSVTDAWQGFGLGVQLLHFIIRQLKTENINRIILWSGVQATNINAIKFYTKSGFSMLGQFEYNGLNYDMMLHI